MKCQCFHTRKKIFRFLWSLCRLEKERYGGYSRRLQPEATAGVFVFRPAKLNPQNALRARFAPYGPATIELRTGRARQQAPACLRPQTLRSPGDRKSRCATARFAAGATTTTQQVAGSREANKCTQYTQQRPRRGIARSFLIGRCETHCQSTQPAERFNKMQYITGSPT